jgi:hypothetical protein
MSKATVDWKVVETLLNVADLARQWPVLKPLHDEAMDVLGAIVKDVAEARSRFAADERRRVDVEAASKARVEKEEAEAEAKAQERKLFTTPTATPRVPPPVSPPNLTPPPSPHRGLFGDDRKDPDNG